MHCNNTVIEHAGLLHFISYIIILQSSAASLCKSPSAFSTSCHNTVAPTSFVGRFLLQARQSGTRCQTISVIRRSLQVIV